MLLVVKGRHAGQNLSARGFVLTIADQSQSLAQVVSGSAEVAIAAKSTRAG